jgi:Mor family transcriptional regulator
MLDALETLIRMTVRDRLAGSGLPTGRIEELATAAGNDAAETVRRNFGGGQIYIPLDSARRDAEIYRAFNGYNHFELAHTYRLSVNTIYKILRAEKSRRTVKQLRLL